MIDSQASAVLKSFAGTVATNGTAGYTWENSMSGGRYDYVDVCFVAVPTTQAANSTHVLDAFAMYEGETTNLTSHSVVSGAEGSATPAATQFQLSPHTNTGTNMVIRVFRQPRARYGSIRWSADANYTTFAFVVRGSRPDQTPASAAAEGADVSVKV